MDEVEGTLAPLRDRSNATLSPQAAMSQLRALNLGSREMAGLRHLRFRLGFNVSEELTAVWDCDEDNLR